MKNKLEQIISKIPTKKQDLFSYPINWKLFISVI